MNWRGKVLLWEEQGLFIGAAGTASLHESPAIKICISLENNFQLRASDNEQWHHHTSAIIHAGTTHAIEGLGNKMAMLLLAPEGKLGQLLIPVTSENRITEISTAVFEKILPLMELFENSDIDGRAGGEAYQKVIELITTVAKNQENPAIDFSPQVLKEG